MCEVWVEYIGLRYYDMIQIIGFKVEHYFLVRLLLQEGWQPVVWESDSEMKSGSVSSDNRKVVWVIVGAVVVGGWRLNHGKYKTITGSGIGSGGSRIEVGFGSVRFPAQFCGYVAEGILVAAQGAHAPLRLHGPARRGLPCGAITLFLETRCVNGGIGVSRRCSAQGTRCGRLEGVCCLLCVCGRQDLVRLFWLQLMASDYELGPGEFAGLFNLSEVVFWSKSLLVQNPDVSCCAGAPCWQRFDAS